MSPQFWSAKAIVRLTVHHIVAVQASRLSNTAAGSFAPNYTLYPGSCKVSRMAVYVVSVKVGGEPLRILSGTYVQSRPIDARRE